MINQNDSIAHMHEVGGGQGAASDSLQQPRTWQPTVRQVLSWLPRNATPAQQDSAVQAHIKPSDITWSQCPDTLHLPGQPVGKSFRDVSLPKYYRESYFTGKPFFHPDMFGGRQGIAGDPVPYSIAGDNIITLLLLSCFVIGALAYAKSKTFMHRQIQRFFRSPRRDGMTDISETGTELRFQLFLVVLNALLIGLVYFFYVQTNVATTFIIDQYMVIGIFALAVLGFIAIKALLYWATAWVFFDTLRGKQWLKSWLVIMTAEGILLYPVVMVQAYFDTSITTTLLCASVIVILARLLSFYKVYNIFFSARRAIVQNFLYFCTLEIIPMAALWGILTMICNYLKVNF